MIHFSLKTKGRPNNPPAIYIHKWIKMRSTLFEYFFKTYIMSIESSTMQDYNTQLVHCLDEIREKRDAITQQKSKREAEKVVLLTTMKKLQTELSQIEEDLVKYSTDSVKYNQTIQETETAYMKIVESSKTLLHVLREESNNN